MSNSVRPHRRQPTRLLCPWDSPGKNTGVGCHFLLQCMKVKSESKVAQSSWTLSDPMDCSPPGSSVHGIFQARVLEWGAIAFSVAVISLTKKILTFKLNIGLAKKFFGFFHKMLWKNLNKLFDQPNNLTLFTSFTNSATSGLQRLKNWHRHLKNLSIISTTYQFDTTYQLVSVTVTLFILQ